MYRRTNNNNIPYRIYYNQLNVVLDDHFFQSLQPASVVRNKDILQEKGNRSRILGGSGTPLQELAARIDGVDLDTACQPAVQGVRVIRTLDTCLMIIETN